MADDGTRMEARVKTRHWVTLIVVAVVGALVAGIFLRLGVAGDGEDGGSGSATEDSVRAAVRSTAARTAFATEIAVPVRGARVRRDTFVLWVKAAGEAAALRAAALGAEVAGPVLDVPVREGQQVASGQLLARIDPAEYALRVREAEARLEEAEAKFQELTLGDDRIEDEVLRRERERLARIRSGLAAAEAALQRARYELAKTEVLAPFAGRVANVSVVEGSRLRSGDSVAAVLDLSRVDVDVDVQETALPFVQIGRGANARFAALPDETFTGRVVTVNPLVNPETRTARVTVRLANPEARIRPGMYANVEIAGRLLPGRTFVPREAIVERDRRQVVFSFEPAEPGAATGVAKWTYVTPGLENDRYVELVAGEETEVPEPGSIVLVDGHATLVHDARVRIENADELGMRR